MSVPMPENEILEDNLIWDIEELRKLMEQDHNGKAFRKILDSHVSKNNTNGNETVVNRSTVGKAYYEDSVLSHYYMLNYLGPSAETVLRRIE